MSEGQLPNFDRDNILGMEIDQISSDQALGKIVNWSIQARARYVCVSNVHQCMEAFDDPDFRKIINLADLVIPDSQVLAWAARFVGVGNRQPVIRGVDLMKNLCQLAAAKQIRIGLYGGTRESLAMLQRELRRLYPELLIAVAIAPPFRPLTARELLEHNAVINDANVQLLFVGIGCPKQEKWMATQKDSLSCVMIGVGAAFDFISGVTRPSPKWVHPLGLEWLYRLWLEPRRLWKRYFKHNPRFLMYLILQRLGSSLASRNRSAR